MNAAPDPAVADKVAACLRIIDATLSRQLAAILHHPEFQRLEGSWRGLHYLVTHAETGHDIKIGVLNATRQEVGRDLERAGGVEDSCLIRQFHWRQWPTPGEQIFYAVIVVDYPFTHPPDDLGLLQGLAAVGAATHCLFLGTASFEMFGLGCWEDLTRVRDVCSLFDRTDYREWNDFRQSDESRFVVLTLPRTLARRPYGRKTSPVPEFDFEEVETDGQGEPTGQPTDRFTWMNTAFLLATNLMATFHRFGLITRIPGYYEGEEFRDLPVYLFNTDDGDPDPKCPTEIGISGCSRYIGELQRLGFVPLAHVARTDYAEFFGPASVQKPRTYPGQQGQAATENAAIVARLPFLLTTARFMHYLARIAVDLGPSLGRAERERWLIRWISRYVNPEKEAGPEVRARQPLRAASIRLHEEPGRPGMERLEAHLRPWLRYEELQSAIRLEALIPTGPALPAE